MTNDLNLNKVAELQGVRVLNINELCNALRPVVLPGETIRVFVLKEGKEAGQGVAYLDDGTMIVAALHRPQCGCDCHQCTPNDGGTYDLHPPERGIRAGRISGRAWLVGR